MLAQLRLQNFRCFDDHVVPIRDCTVIVGNNNAGKSTLVDALRLVSIASARFFTLAIRPPVNWGNVRVPLRELGNPNLAVVCDAEQIVYASCDKASCRFVYEAGAIERPEIKNRVVQILERTEP